MGTEQGCIFCQIVSGAASCVKILEDDLTLVFMDLFPVTAGHCLVIPKEHCENIYDISDVSITAAAAAARRVAHAIRSVRKPEGLAVYQANGVAAGQTVFHYHTHLIPRFSAEPLQFHGRQKAELEALEEMAGALRAAVD